MPFVDWIAAKLGTRRWVVARKSALLQSKGYEVFISQARYTALYAEWKADHD